MKLSHSRCIDTALFHHPTSEVVAGMDYTQVARLHYTGLGPGGHISEKDACACIDPLMPRLRAVRSGLTCSSRDQADNFASLKARYGEFISARSHSRNRLP